MNVRPVACSLVLVLLACDPTPVAPVDAAGHDAARVDASVDAGATNDAGLDAWAPSDAGTDAFLDPRHSMGCVDGEGLPEGETTFELDGLTRRYVVRLPTGYTRDRAWPIVLALHGNGGTVMEWDRTTGTQNIRAVLADDAVLIVTEAIDHQWRDYEMASATWPARIEQELAYFDEILNRAQSELCIDRHAIFSMGFSGGGSFSGVLACRRTDIRAIAVGGAVVYFDEDECVGTPAAWITIGDMETNAGRTGYRDYWRDRAGCGTTSTASTPSGCIAYDDCDAQTPVTFCSHPAGHVWPSFGSQAMWDFFEAQID